MLDITVLKSDRTASLYLSFTLCLLPLRLSCALRLALSLTEERIMGKRKNSIDINPSIQR